MKARGKGTIIVASIFLLIIGGIIVGLMTAVLLNGGYEVIVNDKIDLATAATTFGAYLIGVLDIIAAFIGFTGAGKPEKAKLITTLGLTLTILTLLWFVPEIITDKQTMNWFVYGFAVAVPVIYYGGGKQNEIK